MMDCLPQADITIGLDFILIKKCVFLKGINKEIISSKQKG